MKPYYRTKGKYSDNRKRIIIEQEGYSSIAIPKPEILRELLINIYKNYKFLIGQAKRSASLRVKP